MTAGPRPRRLARRLVRIALPSALVAGAAFYLYASRERLSGLRRVEPSDLVLLLAIHVVFFTATGATFALLVRALGVSLRLHEWLGLTFINTALNYLGPIRPGALAKAAYLKRRKGLSYARFSSAFAANGFLLFLYSGLGGLALLLLGAAGGGPFPWPLGAACAALLAAGLLPFWPRFTRVRLPGKPGEALARAVAGLGEIRRERALVLAAGLGVLAQYLFSGLSNFVAYRALGLPLSFLGALSIGVFTSISNFFTFTPNNVGIQELVMGYLSTVCGLDFASGVLGAALVRGAHLVVTFLGAAVFALPLLRGRRGPAPRGSAAPPDGTSQDHGQPWSGPPPGGPAASTARSARCNP